MRQNVNPIRSWLYFCETCGAAITLPYQRFGSLICDRQRSCRNALALTIERRPQLDRAGQADLVLSWAALGINIESAAASGRSRRRSSSAPPSRNPRSLGRRGRGTVGSPRKAGDPPLPLADRPTSAPARAPDNATLSKQ